MINKIVDNWVELPLPCSGKNTFANRCSTAFDKGISNETSAKNMPIVNSRHPLRLRQSPFIAAQGYHYVISIRLIFTSFYFEIFIYLLIIYLIIYSYFI